MSDKWADSGDGDNQAGRNETTQFPPVGDQPDYYGQPHTGQYSGQPTGAGYPQQPSYPQYPGYQQQSGYQQHTPQQMPPAGYQSGYQQPIAGNYGSYDPQFPVAGGPQPAASYNQSPENKSSVLPLILGICVLLLIIIVVVVLWFKGIIGGTYTQSDEERNSVTQSDGTGATPSVDDDTQTSEAQPTDNENSRPEYPDLPGGAVPANAAAKQNAPAGNFNNVYYDESYTSEAFAIQVREAYARNYLKTKELNATVVAYSPVTGKDYTMRCRDNGRYVTCTGGFNAIVYIA